MTEQIVGEYKRLSVVLKSSAQYDRVEWCDHVFCVDFYNKYHNSDCLKLLQGFDPFCIQVLSRYVDRAATCFEIYREQLFCINIEDCYMVEKRAVDILIKEQYARCKEMELKVDGIRANLKRASSERNMEIEQRMYRRLYDYHVGLLNNENSEFYRLADRVRLMDSAFQKYNENIFENLARLNGDFVHAIKLLSQQQSYNGESR